MVKPTVTVETRPEPTPAKPPTKREKAKAAKAAKLAPLPAKEQKQSVPLPRDAPAERKPAFYVRVNRKPQLQRGREKLPIFAEEQPIMEALRENDVLVLCGATGCGKSTQLPQFLYEAGYGHPDGVPGMVGCTQPRRVAAITTAKRVALELNLPLGREVGYQVPAPAAPAPQLGSGRALGCPAAAAGPALVGAGRG